MACGALFPQPGIEPMPLHWKHRVLTTRLPGKSCGRASLFVSKTFHSAAQGGDLPVCCQPCKWPHQTEFIINYNFGKSRQNEWTTLANHCILAETQTLDSVLMNCLLDFSLSSLNHPLYLTKVNNNDNKNTTVLSNLGLNVISTKEDKSVKITSFQAWNLKKYSDKTLLNNTLHLLTEYSNLSIPLECLT